MIPKAPRRKLGAMLLSDGIISDEQLRDALDIQKETGKPLGQILIEQRYISEEALVKALSEQYQLPFIEPTTYQIDAELVKSFPAEMLYRYQFVPLDRIGKAMIIAIAGIIDESLDEFIREVMNAEPMYFIATYSGVARVLEKVVPLSEEQRKVVKEKIKEDARRISDRISARMGAVKAESTRTKPKLVETVSTSADSAAKPPTKEKPFYKEPEEKAPVPQTLSVSENMSEQKYPPPPPPPVPEPSPPEPTTVINENSKETTEAEPVVETSVAETSDSETIDWQSLFDEVDRRIREEAKRRRDLHRRGLL